MNDLPRTGDEAALLSVPPSAWIGSGDGRKHHALKWRLTAATPHQASPFGKAAPSGLGVRALLAEADQQRLQEDRRERFFGDGRFGHRARVGLLAVRQVDALSGAVRTLGFVPITGTEGQQAIYSRTPACVAPPVSDSGRLQHSFRLDRLSPDAAAKVVESKPIGARTAALILLLAPAARGAKGLLAAAGVEAFLEYFGEHPIQPPGSTRRHRRGAHRATPQQPWRRG